MLYLQSQEAIHKNYRIINKIMNQLENLNTTLSYQPPLSFLVFKLPFKLLIPT